MIGIIQVSSDGEKVPYKDYYYRWHCEGCGEGEGKSDYFYFFNFIIIILTAPIFHGEYKFFMAYIKTRAIVMTTISAQSCIVPL